MVDQLQNCCYFALATIDELKGFIREAASIVILAVLINLLISWGLKKLAIKLHQKKKRWQESFIQALLPPLNYFIWFYAAIHTIDLIGKHFFSIDLFNEITAWIKIAAISAFTWFSMRWKKSIMKTMMQKSKSHEINMDPAKLDVVNKVITILIFFIVFLMILEATHSNMNTLIAFGGVGGLAIAFASQEIIGNFFSGAMIYLTKPFVIGDLINIPEKNIEGHVEDIGWYMTLTRTIDKRPVYIPNSLFSKIVVITPSRRTHREFKETFGLRYEDMPKILPVIEEIKEMLKTHPEIDKNQRIAVYLNTFSTYSLDLLIIAFIKKTSLNDYLEIRQDVFLKIYGIIEKHGAKIAVPITYVNMSEMHLK